MNTLSSFCVIGIYVTDMEASLDFYVNKLGFKVDYVYDETCLVTLENDGPTVVIEKTEEPNPATYPSSSQVVLAVETKNLEKTSRKLKDSGVEFLHDGPQEFPAGTFMAFRDPSGNILELLQFKR
ncbi:MAG: VOC family protein [Candidatus Thorarchaeota archaeon]|nr:MAG: VOC family protein [Candidatus Thorarchaeota archaeon]